MGLFETMLLLNLGVYVIAGVIHTEQQQVEVRKVVPPRKVTYGPNWIKEKHKKERKEFFENHIKINGEWKKSKGENNAK